MRKHKRLIINLLALAVIGTGTAQLSAQLPGYVCCGPVCSKTSCGCFLFFCWGEGEDPVTPPIVRY